MYYELKTKQKFPGMYCEDFIDQDFSSSLDFVLT